MAASLVGFLVAALVVGSPAGSFDVEQLVGLLEFVIDVDETTAVECLGKVVQQGQSGELNRGQLAALRMRLSKRLQPVWMPDSSKPLHDAALQLATLWGDPAAAHQSRRILSDTTQSPNRRGDMLKTLAATGDGQVLTAIATLLAGPELDPTLEAAALDASARFDTDEVARTLLQAYPHLSANAQAQSITLLTQRPAWSKRLVRAVQRGDLPLTIMSANHLRTLLASRDQELVAAVTKLWGTVRTERNPERDQVITKMRALLSSHPGDAIRGQQIFHRVCAQCHKIHGSGQEVGPDISRNGRSSFDQLLSNVFDPSLVIGPAYQAVTVVTVDGRILTGLLAEESQQRISLKTQGGKLETIVREDVEQLVPSKLSLMPENLEQQLQPAELVDLFSFLLLDRPPGDPESQRIPGAPIFDPARK